MKIERGQIKIGGGVDRVLDTSQARVWYIDCTSKRPDAEIMTGDRLTLYLFAGEDTLRADRRYKRPTEIDLGPAKGWQAMCDVVSC